MWFKDNSRKSSPHAKRYKWAGIPTPERKVFEETLVSYILGVPGERWNSARANVDPGYPWSGFAGFGVHTDKGSHIVIVEMPPALMGSHQNITIKEYRIYVDNALQATYYREKKVPYLRESVNKEEGYQGIEAAYKYANNACNEIYAEELRRTTQERQAEQVELDEQKEENQNQAYKDILRRL